MCEDHKTSNDELLAKYVSRFIKNPSLPDFSRNLSLSNCTSSVHKVSNQHSDDRAVYLLQRICVDGKQLLVFFDNGCSDFVISKKGVEMLGPRCVKESSNPVILGGVGESKTESKLGIYRVNLPLYDGREVSLSGVCLEQITSKMPEYPLEEVAQEIHRKYSASGGHLPLPKLPTSIGGDVHLMIGVKYLRYHPKMIYQLPSGLAIFQSQFKDVEGRRGIVGGPHKVFENVHCYHSTKPSIHHNLSNQYDTPLLGFKESFLSNSMKTFEEVEVAGSEIMYRCPQCRNCKACKHETTNDIISIKEEVEQSLINASVSIDFDTHTATASLPFIQDPLTRLTNNRDKALKVYQQQVNKLNQSANDRDKQDILESEGKLQRMGYVEYVHNLPTDVQ